MGRHFCIGQQFVMFNTYVHNLCSPAIFVGFNFVFCEHFMLFKAIIENTDAVCMCIREPFDFLCCAWNFLSACVGTFFSSKAFLLPVTSMRGRSFQINSNSKNGFASGLRLSCWKVKFPYALLLTCFKDVFTGWMTKCLFTMCISNV